MCRKLLQPSHLQLQWLNHGLIMQLMHCIKNVLITSYMGEVYKDGSFLSYHRILHGPIFVFHSRKKQITGLKTNFILFRRS